MGRIRHLEGVVEELNLEIELQTAKHDGQAKIMALSQPSSERTESQFDLTGIREEAPESQSGAEATHESEEGRHGPPSTEG